MAFVRTYLIGSVCFASLIGLGFLVTACGSDDDSCADTLNCGNAGGGTGSTGGSGATGGSGGGAGDGSTCDMSKGPSEEACLIDDEFGIFVSPLGDDTSGNGTKQSPYKTLGKAVTEASSASKHVFACDDGSGYTETSTLTLDASFDGLGLFGGFDCASWSYSTTARAKLTGAATAVRIENVPASARVEDFDVSAVDATTAGESSLAMFVSNSEGLTLRRVALTAGKGADGAPGTNGQEGVDGETPTLAQQGKAATCSAAPAEQPGGKWPQPSACSSKGGDGGTGIKNDVGDSGKPGTPLTDVTPPSFDNKGVGSSVVGNNGGPGQPGSNGNAGPTASVTASAGTFSEAGFSPANGAAGSDGFPGQGGGGGGASAASAATCTGASGGAGGMGGCGGTKGTGGQGGGASIALLAWESGVTLDDVNLVAKDAGNGAKGGDAGEGGAAGGGSVGGPAAGGMGKGGDGASGGIGGPGSSGGGGTGGASYALVWHGSTPIKVANVSLKFGTGGDKGLGGTLSGIPGVNPGPDGSDGLGGMELESL